MGIPLSGMFEGEAGSIALKFALCIILNIAYSALFVLLAMTNQNKASVAVISLLIAFSLFFASTYIYSSLNEPEYYDAYEYVIDGKTYSDEARPNSNFLSGTKREVYEFLFDFLPGCQGARIGELYEPAETPVFALYCLIIAVGTTTAGAVIFKKKNIK